MREILKCDFLCCYVNIIMTKSEFCVLAVKKHFFQNYLSVACWGFTEVSHSVDW